MEETNRTKMLDSLSEWRQIFFNCASKILPPHEARLEEIKEKNLPVEFYCIDLEKLDGIFNKLQESEQNSKINLNLSFFDMRFSQFFGLTWSSPSKKMNKSSGGLDLGEKVYFSTALKDEHILIVVEIVAQTKDSRPKSCGWTCFRPFSNERESKRLGFYSGTPRALLFIDEPFERCQYLKEINGLYLNYSLTQKTKLSNLKNFIPENVFIGRMEPIGGIFNDSSIKTSLEKPRLVPQLSVIIDELYVNLHPNVIKFESEFCNLIAQDKSAWDNIKIEPSMIAITERRLKIGVHNGWRFVHEPYVVELSIDDPKSDKLASQYLNNKRLSLKTSLKPKTSETDLTNTSNATRLVMRNSVVLDQVFEDPLCSIVFLIEYVLNIPIQIHIDKDPKTKTPQSIKKRFETHHILIRWSAYSPFSDNLNKFDDKNRIEINMFGSGEETINPENKLVFKRVDTRMQDEQSSKTAHGKIIFGLRKGNSINFKALRHDDNDQQVVENDFDSQVDVKQKLKKYKDSQRLNDTQQRAVYDLYNTMMSRPDDKFQTPEGNLLMSQLLSKANESRMTALFQGNIELYPIHNPAFHQPILALTPGQIGGRTMSRAAYAKLNSANFPSILDRFNKPAHVLDQTSLVQFDLQKEETDMLAQNQIIFQFLAFSRTLESLKNDTSELKPKNIYLTFQFYRFPEFKTPKLKLDKIIEDYSLANNSTPFILKHVDLQTNKLIESPGFMVSYQVDPSNLKFGEKRIFLQYLAHQAMFIDVWDADSLHLIGTCTLQMKELLRQGKEAVQSTFELDVLSTDYDDDDRLNSGAVGSTSMAYSSNSHIKFQGLLHVRMGNVGSPVADLNDPIKETSLAPALPYTRVIASKSAINSFGEQRLLSRKIDETNSKGFISHNFSKAHHMTDTFKDIHAALSSKSAKSLETGDLDPLKKRKLSRMDMVRKLKDADIPPQLLGNHRRVIEEREKDLKIMEFYRNQTKHDQIMNKLNEYITTEYSIYPNFGIVEFFEFVITNPYNEAQTITILIDDPEIQLVTDSREWRHLKLLHQIYTQVEDNMFNKQEALTLGIGNGENKDIIIKYPQVFLRPKETLNIPFKYQTFKILDKNQPFKKSSICFRANDGNPISILSLIVDQQPHVVNQTFRFNECEHGFLKKTIRLPGSTRAMASNTNPALNTLDLNLNGTSIDQGLSQLYVRSSDPNVVCESKPVNIGEPHDIYIKASTGASPNVKKFYIAIYADQYLAVPLQIWKIYLHSLQRIDVACTLGQTSRFSLVLKGGSSSRVVKCYSSLPDEMSTVPEDKFMLPASAVQEINVGVQPSKTGVRHYYLNIVDTEVSSLVHSWFINVNCKPPVITKAFELTLPISTSQSANISAQKRVSFTNPYSTERVFILSTNRDDLLTFKERRIKFLSNEQKTLALRFLPNPFTGFVEIYVFINNENDTNEETFALRIHYVQKYDQSKN
ncbi:unnamed protein product [Brachionus calyciflorus]|uniref:Nephrocystin-4 n=1 Tax=Brachionus calyciflorus TaxID=104777 RepID=A0A813VC88_9BILA|nr:unnamed protein product [Brachionus calyciflorus]